jgi:hypothetical protein
MPAGTRPFRQFLGNQAWKGLKASEFQRKWNFNEFKEIWIFIENDFVFVLSINRENIQKGKFFIQFKQIPCFFREYRKLIDIYWCVNMKKGLAGLMFDGIKINVESISGKFMT